MNIFSEYLVLNYQSWWKIDKSIFLKKTNFNKLSFHLYFNKHFIVHLLKKVPIYPTPSLGQDMTQGQFLSGGLTGLNSEFSFS